MDTTLLTSPIFEEEMKEFSTHGLEPLTTKDIYHIEEPAELPAITKEQAASIEQQAFRRLPKPLYQRYSSLLKAVGSHKDIADQPALEIEKLFWETGDLVLWEAAQEKSTTGSWVQERKWEMAELEILELMGMTGGNETAEEVARWIGVWEMEGIMDPTLSVPLTTTQELLDFARHSLSPSSPTPTTSHLTNSSRQDPTQPTLTQAQTWIAVFRQRLPPEIYNRFLDILSSSHFHKGIPELSRVAFSRLFAEADEIELWNEFLRSFLQSWEEERVVEEGEMAVLKSMREGVDEIGVEERWGQWDNRDGMEGEGSSRM
ncbi:MAG: hypothetical protein Q9170_005679 [Blastenia crenularia]